MAIFLAASGALGAAGAALISREGTNFVGNIVGVALMATPVCMAFINSFDPILPQAAKDFRRLIITTCCVCAPFGHGVTFLLLFRPVWGAWIASLFLQLYTVVKHRQRRFIVGGCFVTTAYWLYRGVQHSTVEEWEGFAWLLATALYSTTYNADDGLDDGSHYSPWFHNLVLKYVVPEIEAYFQVKVISEAKLPDGEGRQYVVGCHPHGFIPVAALLCHNTAAWQRVMPKDLRIVTHSASMMYRNAVLKDVIPRLGGRTVNKDSIMRVIDQGFSPLIVPGGQREVLLTGLYGDLKIYGKHVGFIRVAIQRGLPLLPVVICNATRVLSNVHAPSMQTWTLKHFGAGFPLYPIGRLGLPIPRNVPLTILVGEPISVRKHEGEFLREYVVEVARAYFEAVRALFYRHRAEAGLEDWECTIEEPIY